jgi:mitochondrial pyruvate carrier 2
MAGRLFGTFKSALLNKEYGWKTTHFWGPLANWGISLATVYSMVKEGPEKINTPLTIALSVYSGLFIRFAWMVSPRNYLLFACHIFNEGVQMTQLRRKYKHDKEIEAAGGTPSGYSVQPAVLAFGMGAVGGTIMAAPIIHRGFNQYCTTGKVKNLINHPAGPFTVFFWAPLGKWLLSATNIIEYKKPVDTITGPQQGALALTGLIWARYSMVITPVNYSLATVNLALFTTGSYHIARKYVYDPFGTGTTH